MIGKIQHRLEILWIVLTIPSVIWLLPALYANLWLPFFVFIIPPCILGIYITLMYDILRIGKNNSRGDNRQQDREQREYRDNQHNNQRHEQQTRQQNNLQQQQLSKKERQRLQQQNQRQRS